MKKRIVLFFCMTSIILAGCNKKEELETDIAVSESVIEYSEIETSISDETVFVDSEIENVISSERTTEAIDEILETKVPIIPTIDIVMVGDILLHTPVEKASLQEDGTYQYDAIFANMKENISEADLAIVNQEVIIGGEELGISGYPAFNAAYSAGDALVNAGFDVILHGTNHALDKGRRGLLNCITFWEEQYPDIAVLGIHDSQESQDEIYIYEQDGMKIAVLNFTYGTNGIPLPDDMPFSVDLLQEEKVIELIKKAEELADFTIVCPHWGTEYQLVQSAAQENWARIFAENGVDLVIGTHPHVIQPIEWITVEETGHEMLVYYSLGNFVNWTSESGAGIANRMVGGMAKVTLSLEADKVIISDYGVEPVVCHLEQGINGVTVYSLEDYTKELAARNQIIYQDSAFNLEYCLELCERVWPEYME